MTGFSPEWLALREPFDAAARSRDLARQFAGALPSGARVADLGGGTGSNVRYLSALSGDARWRIVDSDRVLLDRATRLMAGAVQTDHRDLTGDLGPVLDACEAVTTSALLDLCSAAWIDRLVGALAQRQLPFLAVLSVDGRIQFDPSLPDDALIVDAFARHQRGDKGFGPALGGEASGHLTRQLEAQGFTVSSAASDWRIVANDTAMMAAYLDGVIHAASEAAPAQADRITAWAALRRGQPGLSVRVGHRDVLALPPRRRA
jgi:hypothetical protein